MADTLPTDRLFQDHVAHDIEAALAILFGAMIAAGGGLGGGGVFVPIYILILGYPPKFAAALSQATIFGGSMVNLIMNLRKSHPTRLHRPLTDFSTLLIFEPMLLVGTIIGVLLNVICPDIVILILLAIVLSYATRRTTKKGIRLWKKETKELKAAEQEQQQNKDGNIEIQTIETKQSNTTNTKNNQQRPRAETLDIPHDLNSKMRAPSMSQASSVENEDVAPSVDAQTEEAKKANPDEIASKLRCMSMSEVSVGSADGDGDKYSQEILDLAKGCGVKPSKVSTDKVEVCKDIIENESRIMKPMNIIALVWILVSLFALAKKENITGVEELNVIECSAIYWVITFMPLPFMMAISYYMTKKEYNQYQVKINSGCWMAAPGDIELTGSFYKILKYPVIASVAGILGGLLGIGGGMIVSPLLIELGVVPTVAAATSAMAVLITSSSAMLQFLLLGYLQFDYTFFFMAIGIIGTFFGQTAVNYAVAKYGRVSVVIFAVATIMGLAIILMTINGVLSLIDGVSWEFSAPC